MQPLNGEETSLRLAPEIREILRQQRRVRLLRFWLGFAVILLVGGLWAGLTKDPNGFDGFDGPIADDVGVVDEPDFAPLEEPFTTIEGPFPPVPETVFNPPTTTGPPTTAPSPPTAPTTVPPTTSTTAAP